MKKFFNLLIVLSVFLMFPAFGQKDSIDLQYAVSDTLVENFGLFESNDLLEISLRFDITNYKKERSDKEYLEAILTYHTSEKDSVNKPIKVKARGISRLAICDLPPILLNFDMKDSVAGEFSGINKLKMVTQCIAGNEVYLLKEYLIYKLYNVLTDYSYNVRLLRVNYIDTYKPGKPIREFAFAIEPKQALAKRTKTIEVNSTNLAQKNIKPEIMDRVAIFNYMIGNTDWTIQGQHNTTILVQPGSESSNLGILIPYDFDFSGLVNTKYSSPAEGVDIKSVRERYYLGVCRTEETFFNAIREFSDKKDTFYKIINEFPYLDELSKKYMINYLKGFYNEFDVRNTIVYKFLNNCKNKPF